MPTGVPIPSELNPFAEPGRWIFLNEEWVSVVLGTLQQALEDRYWQGSQDETSPVIQAVLKIYSRVLELAANEIPQECESFQTQSELISYKPTHPYINGDLVIAPYAKPIWTRGQDSTLAGTLVGDVYFTLDAALFELSNVSVLLFILENVASWLGTAFDEGPNLLPRFKVEFSGAGEVELHLLKVPQGGLALISLDGDPLQIVDCQSISVGDINTYIQLLNLIGAAAIAGFTGTLVSENIIEVKVPSSGNHRIDVTFVPKISGTFAVGFPEIGWGGGLRKVVLCNTAGRRQKQPPPLRGSGGLDDLPTFREQLQNEEQEIIDQLLGIEECEMANCGCGSLPLVRFCDGKLQYRNENGDWLDIPSTAITDADAPQTPPPGEVPSANFACWKANGLWAAIEQTATLLIECITGSSTTISAYNQFQSQSAGIDADNAQLLDAIQYTLADAEAISAAFNAQKIDIKQNFICTMIGLLSNTSVLTDAEVEKVRNFEWLTTGSLNTFMEQLDDIPESRWLKVLARNYATSQTGTCNCGATGSISEPEDTDWIAEFNFASAALGWTLGHTDINGDVLAPPTVTADGLRCVNVLKLFPSPNVVLRAAFLSWNFTGQTGNTLKQVTMYTKGVAASSESNPAPNRAASVHINAEANGLGELLDYVYINSGISVGDNAYQFNFNNAPLEVNGSFLIYVQVGGRFGDEFTTVNGDGYIQKLILRGAGANPFI